MLRTVAILLVVRACIMPCTVNGRSMEDTLHHGNRLIVNGLAYISSQPERGDIIVLESDYNTDAEKDESKYLIKRVIGVAGDVIVTDGKTLSINGESFSVPYIKQGTMGRPPLQTWTVPEGCVFVMGDNRDNSADSRTPEIGFIQLDDITGKAVLRFWPPGSAGRVE